MYGDKRYISFQSPGQMDFMLFLIKKFWIIASRDITELVLKFLNAGGSLEDINSTYIVLIPKVKNAINMTDFCPISLCNVIYKFFTKVIANKLKLVLNHVINKA